MSEYIFLFINLCFLQSDHLFLSFPQSSVGTTALSMTFTAFSGTHNLFSSKLQSIECVVQYYCGVWWKTTINHNVQNSGTDLILLHNVTVHWPDRNAHQKAGRSSRAVWYGLSEDPGIDGRIVSNIIFKKLGCELDSLCSEQWSLSFCEHTNKPAA